MLITEYDSTVRGRMGVSHVTTGAEIGSLGTPTASERDHREAWRRINNPLLEWAQDPSILEDDGVDAPSEAAIHRAQIAAFAFRGMGIPAPDRVIPDGIGGVVFEYVGRGNSASIEISREGSITLFVFKDSRIVVERRIV